MLKEAGISSVEAKSRLKQYGFNELKDTSIVSPAKILLRQIKSSFIVYLLLVAMILSFFVGKQLTAYVIMAVIIIVISTGFFQEYKAEKAILALKNMIMQMSIVIRDGKEKEIPSREIVPGDILVLRNGEKIPADCILIDEKDLLVNESILTGESKEVRKIVSKNKNNLDDENMLFMGSFIVQGKCIAKVTHTGMNTKFGKIADMISSAEKELPLQNKVNKIVKYMAFLGIVFSILTGAIFLYNSDEINREVIVSAILIVVAVAVASFPEGFPVVLITALATGAFRMAKKNAIVNRMSIIETLGETTVICSDKTGTITMGEMTVEKIFTDNKIFEVSGVGYEGDGAFYLDGKKVNISKENNLNLLIKGATVCNDARIERTGEGNLYNISGTPTEASLLILGAKASIFREDFNLEREEEIPFSSERKIMSVLVKEGKEKIVYSKGALEILLSKCKYIQRGSGVYKIDRKTRERILESNKNCTSQAYRTLAIAYKKTNKTSRQDIEKDLILLGFVAMNDPPREEVPEAIKLCNSAGINVKMITGDNKETALAIAKQIGLFGKVMEGNEIDDLTDQELCSVVQSVAIFARVRPEHKLRIVKALKEKGEIVTMTGDGVNDAPALKEAHIGVAMGKNGTDVSRSVADLTLKDDNFSTIVDAIKEGRTIFNNIQKFSAYQISINIAQVSLIFLSLLFGMPSPLVAIQILFMNLFSDEITAITLAFNSQSRDILSAKPRKNSEIVNKSLFKIILFAGFIMSIISMGVFYYMYNYLGNSEEYSRTVVFATMVFFGIMNAFNFRSFRKPTLNRSLMTNKYLFFAAIFVIVSTFSIIYLPFGRIFEIVPISSAAILGSFGAALSIIVLFDLFKVLNSKHKINFSHD